MVRMRVRQSKEAKKTTVYNIEFVIISISAPAFVPNAFAVAHCCVCVFLRLPCRSFHFSHLLFLGADCVKICLVVQE